MIIIETEYGSVVKNDILNCYEVHKKVKGMFIQSMTRIVHRYELIDKGRRSAINQLLYLTNKMEKLHGN